MGLKLPLKDQCYWRRLKSTMQILSAYKRPTLKHHHQWKSEIVITHIFFLEALTRGEREFWLLLKLIQLIQSHVDPGGMYVLLICTIDNVLCTIANVYAANTHQIAFLNKLWRKIKKVKKRMLIWCGEVSNASINSTSKSIRCPIQLKSWLMNACLYDAWRCHHAMEKDFTFY